MLCPPARRRLRMLVVVPVMVSILGCEHGVNRRQSIGGIGDARAGVDQPDPPARFGARVALPRALPDRDGALERLRAESTGAVVWMDPRLREHGATEAWSDHFAMDPFATVWTSQAEDLASEAPHETALGQAVPLAQQATRLAAALADLGYADGVVVHLDGPASVRGSTWSWPRDAACEGARRGLADAQRHALAQLGPFFDALDRAMWSAWIEALSATGDDWAEAPCIDVQLASERVDACRREWSRCELSPRVSVTDAVWISAATLPRLGGGAACRGDSVADVHHWRAVEVAAQRGRALADERWLELAARVAALSQLGRAVDVACIPRILGVDARTRETLAAQVQHAVGELMSPAIRRGGQWAPPSKTPLPATDGLVGLLRWQPASHTPASRMAARGRAVLELASDAATCTAAHGAAVAVVVVRGGRARRAWVTDSAELRCAIAARGRASPP